MTQSVDQLNAILAGGSNSAMLASSPQGSYLMVNQPCTVTKVYGQANGQSFTVTLFDTTTVPPPAGTLSLTLPAASPGALTELNWPFLNGVVVGIGANTQVALAYA